MGCRQRLCRERNLSPDRHLVKMVGDVSMSEDQMLLLIRPIPTTEHTWKPTSNRHIDSVAKGTRTIAPICRTLRLDIDLAFFFTKNTSAWTIS